MSTIRLAPRSVGAVIAGIAVISLGTLLTFTFLAPNFGYSTSGPSDLLLGTFGAIASGLAGGFVAAWLAANSPRSVNLISLRETPESPDARP